MRKILSLASIFLVAATASWAQSQVATVSSSSQFTLRGATVTPGQGVPMWPVLAGDTIKAGSNVLIVTFPDASAVVLEPGAEATMDVSPAGTPIVKLVSGSARYSLKSTSAVQLMVGNKVVTPKNLAGGLTTSGGGLWTPVHTAIIVGGAGAAAGLGVGVSQATSGGAAVSPSH